MTRFPGGEIPRVVAAQVCGAFSLLVDFDDGMSKQVDLRPLLNGPIFEPLRDPDAFANVRVDHEAGTIVWPNGADVAPETLYSLPDERDTAA